MRAAGIGTMTSGQSASSLVTIESVLGFSNSVTLSCYVWLNSEPAYSTSCSVSPATVQLAANRTATSTLTVNTSASAAAINNPPFRPHGREGYALWFSISGLVLAIVRTPRMHNSKRVGLFAGALLAVLLFPSCGGSGGGTSSAGGGGGGGNGSSNATYTVAVTATSSNVVRMTTLTVIVQ